MSQPDQADMGTLLPWERILRLIVVSDIAMTLLGLYLAHQARYLEGLDTPFVHNVLVLPLWYLVPIAVLWVVSFRSFGLYERANLVSGVGEYRRISISGLVTTLAVIVLAYIRVNPYIARGFLLVSLLLVVVMVGSGRFWIRRYVYAQARRGHPLERVIVVGTSRNALSVARQLTESASASAEVVGFLSEYMPKGTVLLSGKRVLGEPLELQHIAEQVGATRALVVESGLSWESLQAMVRLMHRRNGVNISLIPGLFDLHATEMVPQQLGPVLALTPQPSRIVGVDAALKRSLDLLLGSAALLISLPVIVTLLAISAFYRQGLGLQSERVMGTHGHFTTWTFMGPDWARRAHLTRLPSLMLVMRGTMSLLGPRPVPLARATVYADAMEFLELAKPGFIGPWWLVGKSEPDDIADELGYDLHYLRHYSIWLDVHILIQATRHLLGARVRISGATNSPDTGQSRIVSDHT